MVRLRNRIAFDGIRHKIAELPASNRDAILRVMECRAKVCSGRLTSGYYKFLIGGDEIKKGGFVLIVKVFVNRKQIDEIHIQNVEEQFHESDFHHYKVVKPKCDGVVVHNRSKSYHHLLKAALRLIHMEGKDVKTK